MKTLTKLAVVALVMTFVFTGCVVQDWPAKEEKNLSGEVQFDPIDLGKYTPQDPGEYAFLNSLEDNTLLDYGVYVSRGEIANFAVEVLHIDGGMIMFLGLSPMMDDRSGIIKVAWTLLDGKNEKLFYFDIRSGNLLKKMKTGALPPKKGNFQWLESILAEMEFALSKQLHNGRSTKIFNGWWAGDWDYVASNPTADRILTIYYGWTNRGQTGVGLLGQCKFAINLILARAIGNYQYHLPSGYAYANGNWRYVRPGDVLQRPANSNHTALAYEIKAFDIWGNVTMIDVMDSNLIAPNRFGMHFLSTVPTQHGSFYRLENYGYYRLW